MSTALRGLSAEEPTAVSQSHLQALYAYGAGLERALTLANREGEENRKAERYRIWRMADDSKGKGRGGVWDRLGGKGQGRGGRGGRGPADGEQLGGKGKGRGGRGGEQPAQGGQAGVRVLTRPQQPQQRAPQQRPPQPRLGAPPPPPPPAADVSDLTQAMAEAALLDEASASTLPGLVDLLCAHLLPPPELAQRDEWVRRRLEGALHRRWPDASVAIYGSAGSGLRVGASLTVPAG